MRVIVNRLSLVALLLLTLDCIVSNAQIPLENGVAVNGTLPIEGSVEYLFQTAGDWNFLSLLLELDQPPQPAPGAIVYAQLGHMPTNVSYTYSTAGLGGGQQIHLNFTLHHRGGAWYFLVQSVEAQELGYTLVVNASLLCPNNCSGHGTCQVSGNCECDPGYKFAPDCSMLMLQLDNSGEPVSLPALSSGQWAYLRLSVQVDWRADEASAAGTASSPPSPSWAALVLQVVVNASANGQQQLTGAMLYAQSDSVPSRLQYAASWALGAQAGQSFELQLPGAGVWYLGLQAGPLGLAAGVANLSATATLRCPNDCNGPAGQCTPSGCACLPWYSGADCGLFDAQLENNQSISAELQGGRWAFFHLQVADVNTLEFEVSIGGDAPELVQVYARALAPPSQLAYDALSAAIGPQRLLSLQPFGARVDQSAVWYLGVWAPQGSGTYTLQVLAWMARVCPNNCNGNGLCLSGVCECSAPYVGADCSAQDLWLAPGDTLAGQVAADQFAYFHVQVLGQDALLIEVEEADLPGLPIGAVTLFLRRGAYPTSQEYDYRNASLSRLHSLYVPSEEAEGVWFLGVLGSARLGYPGPQPVTAFAPFHVSATLGCEAYRECETCAQDPNCGWCLVSGLEPEAGICTAGDPTGPYLASCAAWLFHQCDAGAQRRRSVRLGLYIGAGLAAFVIVLLLALAFLLYRYHVSRLRYSLLPTTPAIVTRTHDNQDR